MGNRIWLMLGCVCGVLGCSSVRQVNVKSSQPIVLTGDEARQARTKGLQLAATQPRDLARMSKGAQLLEQVARSLPDDYDAQWQAAEALAFVAENEANKDARVQAAKSGITLTRHGCELNPKRGECFYWYAINVGLLADADRSYGMNGVAEMETALKRAIELDEGYDYGGPLRVFGILYLRTPEPPISIGSPRKGLRMLKRATELFPDYPENWLYVAEALRDNHQPDEARTFLQKVIAAPLWSDRQSESARWKADAEKILGSLPGK